MDPERLRPDRRDALVLLALAALPWIFFLPLFLPTAGRFYLASGDFVDQFYAFASFEARQLASGHLPLWNPYAYSGSPFWADVQAAVAYPPRLLTVLGSVLVAGRLPFAALEAEAAMHLVLAAWFTYAFARRVTRRRGAALVGALAFTYGGYLTGYPLLQLAVLESNVWLPLALLGTVWIVAEQDGSRRWPLSGVALTAVALGMGVLAGHPQSALFLLVAVTAFFAWQLAAWGRRLAGRGGRRRPLLGFGAAVALGAGLSAAGWMPAVEYMHLSTRASSDFATLAHGFPPHELLGMFLPGITLWSPLYIGILPLLFAAVALRHWNLPGADRDIVFWALLGAAALLLSLGSHAFGFDLAYLALPGFDLFRGQERAAVLVSLALAMLAAHGVAAWQRGDGSAPKTVAMGGAALAGVGGLLALSAGGLLAAASAPAVHLAAWSAVAAAVGAAAWRWPRRSLPLVSLVALVSLLDLHAANGRTDLQANVPGEVGLSPLVAQLRLSPGRVQNDDRLPRNFGVLHSVETTYGASPLRLQWYEDLYTGLGSVNEERLWQLLAVTRVATVRAELPGAQSTWRQPASGGDTYVHTLTPAPYAWVASAAQVVPDVDETVRRLAQPDFAPYDTVILAQGRSWQTAYPATRQVAKVRSRAPGRVEVLTGASGTIHDDGGWLVLSEIYHPGWRATIDGQPTEVVRADVALLAVRVPPGNHDVQVTFSAGWVLRGALVSLASALGLLALFVRVRRAAVGGAA